MIPASRISSSNSRIGGLEFVARRSAMAEQKRQTGTLFLRSAAETVPSSCINLPRVTGSGR
jgi:hypothetical protein